MFIPPPLLSPAKRLYERMFVAKSGITQQSAIKHNEQVLLSWGMSIEKIKLNLKKHGIDYESPTESWHYHLFAGLGDGLERDATIPIRFLEIGTHDGRFANYLSMLFPDAEIYTIDLPDNDPIFTSTYGREAPDERREFVKSRDQRLSRKNIKFKEMHSTNIALELEGVRFAAIWVDGDHHNPQVTIDILNSLVLLEEGGIMLVDDVIFEGAKTSYVSNESFHTLQNLDKNGVTTTHFIFKRTGTLSQGKYIGVSSKNSIRV